MVEPTAGMTESAVSGASTSMVSPGGDATGGNVGGAAEEPLPPEGFQLWCSGLPEFVPTLA